MQRIHLCIVLLVISTITLLVGCSPKGVTPGIEDRYGCKEPPPDTFTAVGVDVGFAQSTYGKLVTGDIDVKTDPSVISLASKAVTDARIQAYLRCLALNRDNYTREQAAYLETMNYFLSTKPTAKEFAEWQRDNKFPSIPQTPTEQTSAAPGRLLPLGKEVVLDISQRQHEWIGLTAGMRRLDFEIRFLDKPLVPESFQDSGPGVLIIPLPFHEVFNDSKVKLIKSWVERGGGLLILGYYAADTHHGSNPSRLTREWGISFNDDLVMPSGASEGDARAHVFSSDRRLGVKVHIDPHLTHEILRNVATVVMVSTASLKMDYVSVPYDFILMSPKESRLWRPEGPMDPQGMRPLIERWLPTIERSLIQ